MFDVVYRIFNKHWKSKKTYQMQIRQNNSAKLWNLDIKTSSPDTQESQSTDARMCQLQQKMTLSWQQVLSHKYQYQYPVQQDCQFQSRMQSLRHNIWTFELSVGLWNKHSGDIGKTPRGMIYNMTPLIWQQDVQRALKAVTSSQLNLPHVTVK